MASYVKFQKGSQAAYDNLTTKNPNTLYFVYEEGASVGKLYIGSTLISGGDISVANGSLAELTDVILTNVQTNNFLVYENNKWVNKSAADIADIILQFNTSLEIVDGKLSIAGFNTANSNTVLSKDENGNLVWITNEIDETLQDIQNALGQPGTESVAATGIYAELENKASKEDLANINKLVKEVVDTLPENGEENIIYLIPNDNGSRDEWMWINNDWEKIGNTEVDLSNYITTDNLMPVLNSHINTEHFEIIDSTLNLKAISIDHLIPILGDLNAIKGEDEETLTVVEAINELYDIVSWEEIPTV